MKTFGEVFKEARKILNLNQDHVAKAVQKITGEKFSRAALSQIESGSTKQPTPQNFLALCEVYGLDHKEVIKKNLVWKTLPQPEMDKNNSYPNDITNHLIIKEPTPRQLAWNKLFEGLTAKQQDELIRRASDFEQNNQEVMAEIRAKRA